MPSDVEKSRLRLYVEALRSNEYEQTDGTLARLDQENGKISFCCLGVACEVAIANGLPLNRELRSGHDSSTYAYSSSFSLAHESTGFLPFAVREWYGLDSDNPDLRFTYADTQQSSSEDVRCQGGLSFFGPEDVTTATAANDILKLPFTAIADMFERTYLPAETLPILPIETETETDTNAPSAE